jgi:hypothetical protein
VALGSTQSLTEMSTSDLPGNNVRKARKAENLITICEEIVQNMWKPRRLTTLWASTDCYRDICFYLVYFFFFLNFSKAAWIPLQATTLKIALKYFPH